MTMPRQWLLAGGIVCALLAGGAALTRFGSGVEQVGVGAQAPDFRAVDLGTGDSVSLRQRYRGAVTLVNVWATWCVPCRVEMPAMERLYQALSPQGFKIAAVSIDEGAPEDVQAFAQELGLSFDLLQDRSTRIQQIYHTTGVPESFLLNRQGIIVKRVIGAHDWASTVNRGLIERLLNERN
jgi:cytochrome c biogenesis protein CcmG, thiol:disulfide interchange protein DsbE